ncbi:MAG: beta-hydroxyacyl-ACP dehydratase [Deltaproteobacteria bacterium]|nr:beta-hydroxyacyl-ACP dehydratase [Deltaproteobacteria bacterium]
MAADPSTREMVLKAVPQQVPFRFIDEILELDDAHIVGAYRFRPDEFFYRGHFPGQPVTPGVIMIETMAQTGVVAFGIYLAMTQWRLSLEEIRSMTTLFTHAEEIEFRGILLPGERVIVRGQKIYLRRKMLKAQITMERESGEQVCSGILSGMAVPAETMKATRP